jgi:hypothetical protein
VVLAVGLVILVTPAVGGAETEVLGEPAQVADRDDRIVVAIAGIGDGVCGGLRMAGADRGEQHGRAEGNRSERDGREAPTPALATRFPVAGLQETASHTRACRGEVRLRELHARPEVRVPQGLVCWYGKCGA